MIDSSTSVWGQRDRYKHSVASPSDTSVVVFTLLQIQWGCNLLGSVCCEGFFCVPEFNAAKGTYVAKTVRMEKADLGDVQQFLKKKVPCTRNFQIYQENLAGDLDAGLLFQAVYELCCHCHSCRYSSGWKLSHEAGVPISFLHLLEVILIY